MTYFLLRDYNILLEKELYWSPWASTTHASNGNIEYIAEVLTIPNPKGQRYQSMGICGFCMRLRNYGLFFMPCIWVVGPLPSKALMPHVLRFAGPNTILCRAFGLF